MLMLTPSVLHGMKASRIGDRNRHDRNDRAGKVPQEDQDDEDDGEHHFDQRRFGIRRSSGGSTPSGRRSGQSSCPAGMPGLDFLHARL